MASCSAPPLAAPSSTLSGSAHRSLTDRRLWSEFYDRSAFSRPKTLAAAAARLRKNLTHFCGNYLVLLASCHYSHPFSVIVLFALLAAWCPLYLFRRSDQPLIVLGRSFSDRETLAGLVLFTSIAVSFTPVGSSFFSAGMTGAALVSVHGALHEPEEVDESFTFLPVDGCVCYCCARLRQI